MAVRDRVAAVMALPEGELERRGRAFERRVERLGGRWMSRLPKNRRLQAPPASTTLSQAIDPFSVTTPDTLPPAVSMPRTAQRVKTLAPLARAARAMAGAAFTGSARPSDCV